MLTCVVCNTGMDKCTCPDRDQQLHDVAYNPDGKVMFKWCRTCDKHYARCRCETPKFGVIHAGQWRPEHQVYETLAGPIVPNIDAR